MTLTDFWALIDEARHANARLTEVPAWLISALSQKEEQEITDFAGHFVDCMHRSYDARLWLGAVVAIGGCGDDKFDYFRGWLIAQGRQAFEAALEDPDSMATLSDFCGDYGAPILFKMSSVAKKAFCKRVADDEEDDAATDRFETLFPVRKHPSLKHESLVDKTDEEARALFPRLAAKFARS
jgi:hypothetical protein